MDYIWFCLQGRNVKNTHRIHLNAYCNFWGAFFISSSSIWCLLNTVAIATIIVKLRVDWHFYILHFVRCQNISGNAARCSDIFVQPALVSSVFFMIGCLEFCIVFILPFCLLLIVNGLDIKVQLSTMTNLPLTNGLYLFYVN